MLHFLLQLTGNTMKFSVSWLCDHLEIDVASIDMRHLAALFNQKVAELEGYVERSIDLTSLYIARVSAIEKEIVCSVAELNSSLALPIREGVQLGKCYLIKKSAQGYSWATEADFYGEKNSLVGALTVRDEHISGGWKNGLTPIDYIIEIDNKAITHRPDMWGHRGFAREIGLLLDVPMKSIEPMLTKLQVLTYDNQVPATAQQPFSARIMQPEYIDRFAFAYFAQIHNEASAPWMAARLLAVGLRPIDMLVDITNYVMCDLGQPMHAFDANVIPAKHIELRLAQAHEKLTLLDGETIELTDKDIVVTDGSKPISLAGVMGGADTQITQNTGSILLESAHFEPATVRESAARHKKRTESSARFEKMLDPNQNILAIERFVHLLQSAKIPFKVSSIASMGVKVEDLIITIEHAYIERRLGVTIEQEHVVNILRSLDFRVAMLTHDSERIYRVEVPTFRSTKDVCIKEDLLEEIARLFGYTNIPFVLPCKETKPSLQHAVYRLRRIKQFLAYGRGMQEVANYSFYDEDFIRMLNWQPHEPIAVQSPVSENWKTLVGSLVPGLLKNIWQNAAEQEELSFFEWGRIWSRDGEKICEQKELTAVLYKRKAELSFYDIQEIVAELAHMIRLPLHWQKIDNPVEPWFAPYRTARIMYGDIAVGKVGIADQAFTHAVLQGSIGIFTLQGDFLEEFCGVPIAYKAPSKYPAIERDISALFPLELTVEQIARHLKELDPAIVAVALVDIFQKDDWLDRKSLTFTLTLQAFDKTLTSAQADVIMKKVEHALQELGGEVR